jgi:uroporphyrinogen-III synthase
MNQTGSNKTVVLIPSIGNIWIHNKLRHNVAVVKRVEAYQSRDANKNVSDVHQLVINNNDTKK